MSSNINSSGDQMVVEFNINNHALRAQESQNNMELAVAGGGEGIQKEEFGVYGGDGSPTKRFGLSRWTILSVCLFISLCTGCVWPNWPSTQAIFLHSGAYEWLCHNNIDGYKDDSQSSLSSLSPSTSSDQSAMLLDNLHPGEQSWSDQHPRYCAEQIQSINSLVQIGVASCAVFALVGGLSVDFIGPKFSAMMGLTFQIAGWIVLSFCSQRFPLYPVANMLMGFGSDPVYIALLDSSNLFPGYRGMVIAMLSASRALSFALPSLFNLVAASYPDHTMLLTFYYSYIGLLTLCFVAVTFIFPWRCFARLVEVDQSDLDQSSQEKTGGLGFHFNAFGRNEAKAFDVASNASLPTRCGASDCSFFSNATTAGTTFSLSHNFRPSRALPPRQTVGVSGGSFISESCTPGATSESIPMFPSGSTTPSASQQPLKPSAVTTSTTNNRSIWSVVNSGLYLPLLPIAATTILSGTFFANSSREQLGSALSLFIILNPLSFVSGMCLGYLNDACGPLLVMSMMNALSIVQFTSLLFEDVLVFIPYITAFVSYLVVSFFLTQFYCYVALLFPTRHFGALSGFVVMCSGLLSLVVTPMCDWSSFSDNYVPMNGLCLALTTTNIIFLYILYRKQGHLITWSKDPIPSSHGAQDGCGVAAIQDPTTSITIIRPRTTESEVSQNPCQC